MSHLKFWKMQGTGNDYVCINATEKIDFQPAKLAKRLCDRRFGIGGDGLLLADYSKTADIKMTMLNPDGSEAEMCGNGLRCLARFAFEQKLVTKKEFVVETKAGMRPTILFFDQLGEIIKVKTNMGRPDLNPKSLPAIVDKNPWLDYNLDFEGFSFKVSLVSMGNPHVVVFVENVGNLEIEKFGPIIENDKKFPARTNVEFVEICAKNFIKQRTWERGAKETFSCGTGAVAATVASILTKGCDKNMTIELLGGKLEASWESSDEAAWLSGEAENVFSGQIKL